MTWYVRAIVINNHDKSAASFCCQVAAWVPDIYILQLLFSEIAIYSTTTKAREKSTDLEFLEF
jgi:hypothetical protein